MNSNPSNAQQQQINQLKTPPLNPQFHHLSSQNPQQAPSPLNNFQGHLSQQQLHHSSYYLGQNGSHQSLTNNQNNIRSNSPYTQQNIQEIGPNGMF